MDVTCMACQEPWDAWHMREDFWYDMMDQGRSREDCEDAREVFRTTGKIPDWVRDVLKAAKWELGTTVFAIKHCPGCPEGAVPDESKMAMAQGIEEALGGDTDGIQSMMEDLGG